MRWYAAVWAGLVSLPLASVAQDVIYSQPGPGGTYQRYEQYGYGKDARVRFDERVKVVGPKFAEDPMNVPVSVRAELSDVEQITVLVDRNPIRKVLDFWPLSGTLPNIAFRFKLEQASPVRAAVRTKDGIWHVGGTWVDSSGGGCTVSGATRNDGIWVKTLGQVNARLFSSSPGGDAAARGFRLDAAGACHGERSHAVKQFHRLLQHALRAVDLRPETAEIGPDLFESGEIRFRAHQADHAVGFIGGG